MGRMIRRFANYCLGLCGYQITRTVSRPAPEVVDCQGAVIALTRWRMTPVSTVIDVGASDGRWSRAVMSVFPKAFYFLVEAQQGPHGAHLRQFKDSHPNVDYLIAAAGHRTGTIHFDAEDPFGGVASEKPLPPEINIEVPVTTLDKEVAERNLRPPFLLKLDTHGFEVPIFEGAVQTLRQTELIVVEAYNFTLTDECLRFQELVEYLGRKGFRCLDLFDVMHRPADGALWQMDLIFAPAGRLEFSNNSFG